MGVKLLYVIILLADTQIQWFTQHVCDTVLLGNHTVIPKKGQFYGKCEQALTVNLHPCTGTHVCTCKAGAGERGENVYTNSFRKSFIELWSFREIQLRSDVGNLKSCLSTG